MTSSQELHLVYKNIGETPLECIYRYKKEHKQFENDVFTYAGRLDPMAEGLLILLSGRGVSHKQDYIDLDKTYEFEVLWSIDSDTGDLLGKIVEESSIVPNEENIIEYLRNSLGDFVQKYPEYSSKTVNGKQLFQLARDGKLEGVVLPDHRVRVISADYLHRRLIKKEELFTEIQDKIEKVNGDFRQNEILKIWERYVGNTKTEQFVIDKIKIKVSSGFYVRQFVKDMASHFKTSAVANSIKRVQIGELSLADIK